MMVVVVVAMMMNVEYCTSDCQPRGAVMCSAMCVQRSRYMTIRCRRRPFP